MHTDQITSAIRRAGDLAEAQAARRAGRVGGADARLARRPQRLVLRRPQLRREPAAFSITRGGAGARGLQAMLPLAGPSGALSGLTRAGAAVATTTRTVKGIEYAMFDAAAGDYTATYGTAPPPPPAAPETMITGFAVSGTTARADFTSDTAGAGFQCRLDGAAFTACTSPKQYTSLAAGQHTFQVRAVAAAGTIDATPAERGFTVVSGTSRRNGAVGRAGDGGGPTGPTTSRRPC